MFKGTRLLMFVAISLCAVVSLLMANSGCGAPGATVPPSEPISVEVSISKLPKLNEAVTVTATVTALEGDFPDAEAWITFGYGVYVDGDLTWSGDLVKDEPIQFSATIAFVTEGNHGITAYAGPSPPEGIPHWACSKGVPLYISKEESKFGGVIEDKPARSWRPGEPKHVGIGIMHLDSSMLLNKQPVPVFRVMQSLEDVRQLQAEGLLPGELRFQWRKLEELDFDQFLVIGFWDAARPTSGYFANIPYDAPNDIFWDKGTITVNASLIPPAPETPARARPTSSVAIAKVSKTPIMGGPEEYHLILGGVTEFVFTINGKEVERQTHDIVPKAGEVPRG